MVEKLSVFDYNFSKLKNKNLTDKNEQYYKIVMRFKEKNGITDYTQLYNELLKYHKFNYNSFAGTISNYNMFLLKTGKREEFEKSKKVYRELCVKKNTIDYMYERKLKNTDLIDDEDKRVENMLKSDKCLPLVKFYIKYCPKRINEMLGIIYYSVKKDYENDKDNNKMFFDGKKNVMYVSPKKNKTKRVFNNDIMIDDVKDKDIIAFFKRLKNGLRLFQNNEDIGTNKDAFLKGLRGFKLNTCIIRR